MEVLQEKNVFTNCTTMKKEDIIKKLGNILVADGYVQPPYIDSMLEKEKTFNTAIGNAVAIPHCVEDGRQWIEESGIVVMLFPEGVDWGESIVKVVIGIAGKGDEQIDILMKIATLLSDEEEVDRMLTYDAHTVFEKFTQEEEM